jgi:hypothetical protein
LDVTVRPGDPRRVGPNGPTSEDPIGAASGTWIAPHSVLAGVFQATFSFSHHSIHQINCSNLCNDLPRQGGLSFSIEVCGAIYRASIEPFRPGGRILFAAATMAA